MKNLISITTLFIICMSVQSQELLQKNEKFNKYLVYSQQEEKCFTAKDSLIVKDSILVLVNINGVDTFIKTKVIFVNVFAYDPIEKYLSERSYNRYFNEMFDYDITHKVILTYRTALDNFEAFDAYVKKDTIPIELFDLSPKKNMDSILESLPLIITN